MFLCVCAFARLCVRWCAVSGAGWANATAFEQPPNVLVFGDMHVILQDALVMGLCRRKDVRRVLVSTHRNDDLMEAAREFCTVDSHLILPECSPDLPVEICKAAGIDPSILS